MEIRTYNQARRDESKEVHMEAEVPAMVKRGQIYYVSNAKDFLKIEGGSRPAIIVSTDEVNRTNRVSVVFLTAKGDNKIFKVPVNVRGRESYAICDSVSTIYKERLETYAGDATEQEMKAIEVEIRKALKLDDNETLTGDWKDKPICIGCHEKDNYKELEEKYKKLQHEAKVIKALYDDLLEKVIKWNQ